MLIYMHCYTFRNDHYPINRNTVHLATVQKIVTQWLCCFGHCCGWATTELIKQRTVLHKVTHISHDGYLFFSGLLKVEGPVSTRSWENNFRGRFAIAFVSCLWASGRYLPVPFWKRDAGLNYGWKDMIVLVSSVSNFSTLKSDPLQFCSNLQISLGKIIHLHFSANLS